MNQLRIGLVILHIAEDSTEFLEEARISSLLSKYNKFMPIPIKFGTKEIDDPKHTPKTTKDKDGKETTEPQRKITVDNIINNPNPSWTKRPTELKDEDYKGFYRELYPMQFEEPLFNITDNVEGIVPEFLTMLRGVIDSPDIPLNVSRSYLQADGAVKKISSYITRKVADKLKSLFNNSRESFEAKWNDIKIIIEYGMLSEEKFFEKADAFALYPTVDGKYYTYEELENAIKANQKRTLLLRVSMQML